MSRRGGPVTQPCGCVYRDATEHKAAFYETVCPADQARHREAVKAHWAAHPEVAPVVPASWAEANRDLL